VRKKQRASCQYTNFVSAAVEGNFKRMKKMLSKGFDIDTANESGETAFSWCCQYNRLRSAHFLYKNGANINVELLGAENPHDPSAEREKSFPLDIAVCWASPHFRRWLKSVGGRRMKDFPEWEWPPKEKLKW
jgi:hypothetical protein